MHLVLVGAIPHFSEAVEEYRAGKSVPRSPLIRFSIVQTQVRGGPAAPKGTVGILAFGLIRRVDGAGGTSPAPLATIPARQGAGGRPGRCG